MKVLELFAGTRSIGKAFERRGHEVTSVDYDPKFTDCLHEDAYAFLQEHGEEYDVIWASPCCTTYSVAGLRCHRDKDSNGRYTIPTSEYAEQCDAKNAVLFKWFDEHRGMMWFIENPRGQMLHMDFAKCLEDCKTELCYCQYGFPTMKPTNIWTTLKNAGWRPMCHPGAEHHATNPKTGERKHVFDTVIKHEQWRSVIPDELCDHVVDICERVRRGEL